MTEQCRLADPAAPPGRRHHEKLSERCVFIFVVFIVLVADILFFVMPVRYRNTGTDPTRAATGRRQ